MHCVPLSHQLIHRQKKKKHSFYFQAGISVERALTYIQTHAGAFSACFEKKKMAPTGWEEDVRGPTHRTRAERDFKEAQM